MTRANTSATAKAVAHQRQRRGWTQAELAARCDVSRAEISGIETGRLVPSVLVALRLARILDTTVGALFEHPAKAAPLSWAWAPPAGETRLWRASIDGRLQLFPFEATAAGVIPHDSVLTATGLEVVTPEAQPDDTLVIAGCDPLVGLLCAAMARQGVRVLPLLRSSRAALDLLQRGLVHAAGIHFGRSGNVAHAGAALGSGYRLIHQLAWQAGIATAASRKERTSRALLDANVRWVNREEGSVARQTLDSLLGRRRRPHGYERVVRGHRAVAATVSSGWAEAGMCVKPSAAENGLRFIAVQEEAYELCVAERLLGDRRIAALDATLRTREYRHFVDATPGCSAKQSGEHRDVTR